MSQTVVALFEKEANTQEVVQELTKNGFARERVDVSKGFAPEKVKDSNHRNADEKDGISKFFDSLFGADDSDRYSYAARSCGTIVTVHAQSAEEARKAAKILDDAGAEDIDDLARRCAASHGIDTSGVAKKTEATTQATGGTTIPIIKEEVQIGKREVESGAVRVRSRIVERPVEENLRLREEHVMVERRKVDRPVTDADLKNFKQGEATYVEHKEVPVVSKESKVVEEVRVGKTVEEHKQTVHETEKKTEVDVQKLNTPGNKK